MSYQTFHLLLLGGVSLKHPGWKVHTYSQTGESRTGQVDKKLVGLPGSRHSDQIWSSNRQPGTSDVPSGSILKTTLFVIFINNVDGVHHQHICG